MPERNVFGFGNDDFHDITQFSINWNEFLIERIDEEEIKKGNEKWEFLYSECYKGI